MENQSKGMAVASLVLGIISVVIAAFFGPLAWLGIVLGVVGLVLAVLAKKKGKSGMATAGLVLSIIGLALSAIIFIACTACACAVDNAVEDALGADLDDALSQLENELENLEF